ncbi:AAA family ATPase [Photobacterium profundum]|uniref:ExeA family protein n=1 Tax=Photobacterium profundum TaxID=74109 RepID=UPI003D1102E4
MYKDFFGITETPFSIVPSARFLYLSERHREALTHMLAGLSDGGGFALLTGEVGTGKTTVLRALISRLTQETQVAVILNPALSAHDLLAAICDELGLSYVDNASFKVLTDTIYQHLLKNHSEGKQTLLLVDEAQHLMSDVLEQLRLLTNLETDSRKLLKVVLIGQPELQYLLQQDNLRQLAQRITSRYHLLPLTADEVSEYVNYRLRAVNCLYPVFDASVVRQLAKATGGVPRLINLVCDKAMLRACQHSRHQVTKVMMTQACDDVLSWQLPATQANRHSSATIPTGFIRWGTTALVAVLLAGGGWYWSSQQEDGSIATATVTTVPASTVQVSEPAPVRAESVEEIEIVKVATPVERLQAAITQSRHERQAMQSLYQLWGFDTALNQANCTTSQRIQLTCHQGNTDLNRLGLINRPAMVTLQDNQQKTFYAVVYAVTAKHIELLFGGERIAVKPEWFEQHWQGEYTLLWRPPHGSKTTIRYGQQGPRVAWLSQQLNSFLGETQTHSDYFGQSVLDKLRRFQRSQDLAADGIAGPLTLMVLDSALNLPGPTLQPERS